MPYTVLFEGIGPLLEVSGYAITTIAVLVGLLNWDHYRLLIAVSVLFGASTTLMAVALSDVASRSYARKRDLALLLAAAIVENLGYRQLNAWWSLVGTVQAVTRKDGWGSMTRRAF